MRNPNSFVETFLQRKNKEGFCKAFFHFLQTVPNFITTDKGSHWKTSSRTLNGRQLQMLGSMMKQRNHLTVEKKGI